jgi:hypothetical protein
MSKCAVMYYYAFHETDGGVTCLNCACDKNLTGELANIEDSYPDGFTCDYCSEVIL